jgi:hypothetical protein
VRQGSAEPIQFPNDEYIAGLHIRQRLGQARPIILGTGNMILEQMPAID